MTNPLMEKLQRIPGEMGRLPSHGFGYDTDVFDECVTNGDLEVFPVSAYDEILLKNPELLLSGKAIFEVFARKIPWLKHPEKLFHKDVDFLMTMLRKVSYGDEMSVSYTHNCAEAKDHHYNITLSKILGNTKRIDPTQYNNTFTLPNNQVVKINTPLFVDILEITQLTIKMANQPLDMEDLETATCDAVARTIISVDDVTDKTFIEEWLHEVPSTYRTIISTEMEKLSSKWGIDMTYKVKCKDCGEEINLNPVLNPVSFFI